jgi:hypothetical protein
MLQKQPLLLGILGLVLILSGCVPVPEAEKQEGVLVILPGKGIREITLGKSSSAVLNVMGEPESRTTYEAEREAYASSGFNTNIQLEFILGFDFCFEYSMEQNRSMYPVYKVFLKNDKIHVIMFSAFVYESKFLQNTFIASEELKFYSNTEDMKQVLGTNYIFHPIAIYEIYDSSGKRISMLVENYEIYDYLEQGISVILENDEIVSVQIYPPVPPEIKQQYENNFMNIN